MLVIDGFLKLPCNWFSKTVHYEVFSFVLLVSLLVSLTIAQSIVLSDRCCFAVALVSALYAYILM